MTYLRTSSLYDSALKITEAGERQREIFERWKRRGKDTVYGALGFDTETTSLKFGMPSTLHLGSNTDIVVPDVRVFGISLAIRHKETLALFWGRTGTRLFDECCSLLLCNGPKVAHNAKYDLRALGLIGVDVQPEVNCTLTAARIHWNRKRKVDLNTLTGTVVPDMYGYDDELKGVLRNLRSSYTRNGYPKNYVNYSFIPDEVIAGYAMKDVFITWILNVLLMPHMMREHRIVYRRERSIIQVIKDVERGGMQFDRRRAKKEMHKVRRFSLKLENKLFDIVGDTFNPGSPAQVLIELRNLKVPKKLLMLNDKLSSQKDVLEKAITKLPKKSKSIKFIKTILSLRSQSKIINTYLMPLTDQANHNNGLVFTNINPTDTRTGRMSSSGPSLHTIPRPNSGYGKYSPVRKCFICTPGCENFFLDYSQMEMWLFAILSGEANMLKTLMSGGDIHTQTAIDVLGKEAYIAQRISRGIDQTKRQDMKAVNFGIIYGMGFKALAKKLEKPEAEGYFLRNAYLDTYPRIVEFMDENKRKLLKYGYVSDIFGRRYNIDPRESYKATNALVQGSCAQILKIAILAIKQDILSRRRYERARLVMPIHDELIFELRRKWMRETKVKFLLEAKDRMENVRQLTDRGIILKVGVKSSRGSWEDKKSFSLAVA